MFNPYAIISMLVGAALLASGTFIAGWNFGSTREAYKCEIRVKELKDKVDEANRQIREAQRQWRETIDRVVEREAIKDAEAAQTEATLKSQIDTYVDQLGDQSACLATKQDVEANK